MGSPAICAIVGSGFLNMNPTLVRINIDPIGDKVSKVLIYGSAKEGLIKSKSGEKAVKKISAILERAFSISANKSLTDY
jgi:hypothetical protein